MGRLCLLPSARPECSRTPGGELSLPFLTRDCGSFRTKEKKKTQPLVSVQEVTGLDVAVEAHLGLVDAWAPRWIL